jgi:RHS repeat-associated protein
MEFHMEEAEEEKVVTYTRGLHLISMRREGASYFYHYDGLGSVRQLTGKRICLIATAVYGTPMAEEVKVLSRLRDEYLLTNEWGERLVAFYYRHSPALAEFISEREWAKRAVQIALWPLVRIATLIVGDEDTSSGSGNPNPSVSSRQRDFRRVPIEEEYTYDAFGNLIEGNDHESPYGFTGEQQFREADGLVFLRARYYDPRIGKFVSKDPFAGFVEFPQTLNLYVYCRNNPVNLTDPNGLWGIWFGDYRLGRGNPWLVFDNSSWMEISKGAAATLDGIIPFVDPFEIAYADRDGKVDDIYQWSRRLGAFARNVYIMSLGLRGAGWRPDPPHHGLGPHDHLRWGKRMGPKVPNWGARGAKWRGWRDWFKQDGGFQWPWN